MTAVETVPGTAAAEEQPASRAGELLRWGLPALALLLGLAMAAAGWSVRAGARDRDAAAREQLAGQVVGQVEAALGRAFSYSADQDEAGRSAARAAFTGAAEEQYRRLSEQLRGWTAEQRLTLTTRAVATGVIRLTGDRAELLVLLDQSARRGADPPVLTGAQLRVTARPVDGRWVISDLTSL
ncbi:hypothetical protein GCM10020229_67650 [Kitasatospora albolonga]|uniref:hypothetical protein n=1 Tax=Kitasatospora albolonga TaxID=68173 RepID=UPI0031E7634D